MFLVSRIVWVPLIYYYSTSLQIYMCVYFIQSVLWGVGDFYVFQFNYWSFKCSKTFKKPAFMLCSFA